MKKIIFTFILFFCFISGSRADESFSKTFDEANAAYFNANYKLAEEKFLSLLQSDRPFVLYNLGNTYFQMGELGKALQYFKKARRLLPRFAEANANIKLIQVDLKDKIEVSFGQYLQKTFYFWSQWLNFFEWQVLFCMISVLFWGYFLFRLIKKYSFLRTSIFFCLFFFGYFSGGLFLKWLEHQSPFAIVIPDEVSVHSHYLQTDKTVFSLHEGTQVQITDSQKYGDQDWYLIELPGGQKGWVRAQDLGVI